MEKFAEFHPKTIFFSSFIVFGLFIILLVIFACAQMRQPLLLAVSFMAYMPEIKYKHSK